MEWLSVAIEWLLCFCVYVIPNQDPLEHPPQPRRPTTTQSSGQARFARDRPCSRVAGAVHEQWWLIAPGFPNLSNSKASNLHTIQAYGHRT